MTTSRCSTVLSLGAVALLAAAPGAVRSARAAEPDADPPRAVRVFYLQGMDATEGTRLLRSQVRVRALATIERRNAVVVSDSADQVVHGEALLRDRGALARTVEPHAPLDLERLAEGPQVGGVFRVAAEEVPTALGLLRSIYGIRELAELGEGGGISARAARPVLDAAEALLTELGFEAGPAAKVAD